MTVQMVFNHVHFTWLSMRYHQEMNTDRGRPPLMTHDTQESSLIQPGQGFCTNPYRVTYWIECQIGPPSHPVAVRRYISVHVLQQCPVDVCGCYLDPAANGQQLRAGDNEHPITCMCGNMCMGCACVMSVTSLKNKISQCNL